MPQALLVQESRVQYSKSTSTAHKSSAPLHFDDVVAFDRYLLENKAQAREVSSNSISLKFDFVSDEFAGSAARARVDALAATGGSESELL